MSQQGADRVLLGHGSGGSLMHSLIEGCFAGAFEMRELLDSALIEAGGARLAFTTDSFVVSPLFFPGGDIGELSVYGTVNDLSVAGAEPLFLSAGFIIEEGFPMDDLKRIVDSMSRAAGRAGVRIVTGDTKVVEKGKGDGIFINTAGIGFQTFPPERDLYFSPARIRPGDAVIVSGEVGSHGIAVIAERNGLSFDPPLLSDLRPLNGLVKAMMPAAEGIRVMRDPTRGGLATTLKEFAAASGFRIRIRESEIPHLPPVKGACELLGLDPLYAASEGALVAVASPGVANYLVSLMRAHEYGIHSRIIGSVEGPGPSVGATARKGQVVLETLAGGERMIDMLQGQQLPRIC
ncbi:MAG: hydrogenase expression/formation protein HypE [Nitrospiraceae bacterium]|nr:hydrogenase expression/formation protein HypE [Nitrospiraceae bacterium]